MIDAPSWFIALFGAALVVSGILYFLLRARRSLVRARR